MVMRWTKMFHDDRQETRDLPQPRVGAEKLITNNDTAIKKNRRRNIRDVTNEFNVSIGTVHNIVTNNLTYRKVSCQWVPRMLLSTPRNSKWV
ncbi:hypothetical protein TNCV_4744261 [Trichonephila clavipes]|nr:hypothetical protein TNCV_4744261 [Trichonephila clavipes]